MLLVVGFTSSASHLLGGHIKATQGSSNNVTLTITLISDPQGISGAQTINLSEYKLTNGTYQSNGSVSATQSGTSTFQGFNVTTYTTTLSSSKPNGEYRWVYSNCCRGMLSNASSSMNSDFMIALDFKKMASNSSPSLLNLIPMKWVTNDTTQTILFAFDADGDSVIVEKDDAIGSYANFTFVPLAPFSQLDTYGHYSVASNGVVQWAPSTSGMYGTGYKVSEYRNGSLIGVSRIQHVFSVTTGSTPKLPSPMVQVTHDLVNGDSTIVTIQAMNTTNIKFQTFGLATTKTSDSTWVLRNLQVGNYKGIIRLTNTTSIADYEFSLQVRSTIGIEENVKYQITSYKVYDWSGKYMGTNLENQKGFRILRYENGKVEKIFIQ